MTKNVRQRKRRGAGNARTKSDNSNTRAPVAIARRPVVQPSGSLRQAGIDRIAEIHFAATPSGKVVCNIPINGSIGERLSRYSSLFQRIRYGSLRFEIRSQCTTQLGGGYTAAFVRDPDQDIGDGEGVLSTLMGFGNAKTCNIWQSTVLDAGSQPDNYYTLPEVVGSQRQSSPGRLVIAIDGAVTGPGSLVLLLHWSVTLSEPAVESSVEKSAERVLPSDMWFFDPTQYSETTWKTALQDPDGDRTTKGEYLKPNKPGFEIPAGTIWHTRPYVAFCYTGEIQTGVPVMMEHIIVVDSTEGYFRPAYKFNGKMFDATAGYPASYEKYQPVIGPGEMTVFHKGDIWTEVDVEGKPLNSSRKSFAEISRLRAAGIMWNQQWSERHDDQSRVEKVAAHGQAVARKEPVSKHTPAALHPASLKPHPYEPKPKPAAEVKRTKRSVSPPYEVENQQTIGRYGYPFTSAEEPHESEGTDL